MPGTYGKIRAGEPITIFEKGNVATCSPPPEGHCPVLGSKDQGDGVYVPLCPLSDNKLCGVESQLIAMGVSPRILASRKEKEVVR